MIRKKKKFSRPKKPFEKKRIEEENKLIKRYGLKNKREIWKTLAKVNYFRSRAKALAESAQEEQEVLLKKLKSIGLNVNNLSDILGLRIEDLLERRLPTIITKQKLAKTPKQARQMVAHKNVFIDGKSVNSPSYLVHTDQEKKITIKQKAKSKNKKQEQTEQPAETAKEEKSKESK